MNLLNIDKIITIKSSLEKVTKLFKMKSMEKELEQSKSYLSIALSGKEHGEWDWKFDSNEIEMSPEAQALLGYDKKNKVINHDSFLEMIHHDDRTSYLYGIEKHKIGVTDFVSVDIRMKSAYGHWNWINLRGKIVKFDDEGNPLRFTGINYDINERKQYDEDVEELQQKVIKSEEKEHSETKSREQEKSFYINHDLDRYSQFRMNGLRNILKSN